MINNRKTLPTLQVFHLNVFTEQAFTGNSATVVWLEQNIFKTQMQTLAREFNTPETIFILHNKKTAKYTLFYTNSRSQLMRSWHYRCSLCR